MSHGRLGNQPFAADNAEGWREALARLARRRGGELLELAEDLERS